jgi:hypothetical protein
MAGILLQFVSADLKTLAKSGIREGKNMAKGMKFKQLRNGEKWGGELFA